MEAAAHSPSPASYAEASPSARHRWWQTPLVVLAVYCIISLVLKENYPFSHYPMYANPSTDRAYYIIADAATGKSLPIATVSGVTCPRIGKMWRDKVNALTKKAQISKNDLTTEQKQQIGQAIFDELRVHAKDNKRTGLPDHLLLQRVDILYRNDVMSEVPTTLAAEK